MNKENEFLSLLAASDRAARFLRTLGNANRLLILCTLLERGEMCVNHLGEGLNISQSALSQHLARMRRDGLLVCRRRAQTVYYSMADDKVRDVMTVLKRHFCPDAESEGCEK